MATDLEAISVIDVYDLASIIGKEFEKIIDSFGPESVTELMPKVILALEQLEALTNDQQKERLNVSELEWTIERLKAEKSAKNLEREVYEKDLELIEESYRKESKELWDTVGKLQQENNKLKSLREQDSQTNENSSNSEKELPCLSELKETISKQRDELRACKRDLCQKQLDLEALQSQLERVISLNIDYRRKNCLTQRQARNLIQEKTELQAQLHDKEQQINCIRDHLQHDNGLTNSHPGSPEADSHLDLQKLHLEGKMVIDLADPERPRFTLNELRDVLSERNELKTKLLEVEEELTFYKPSSSDEDERPVQGPINREPDEKLFPGRQENSGIRKFFKFFFGDQFHSPRSGLKGRSIQSNSRRRSLPNNSIKLRMKSKSHFPI